MLGSLLASGSRSYRATIPILPLAGAVAVLALANCSREGGSARSEPLGRIAFVSDRDGNAQVYVMNADGSGLTRLTSDSASAPSSASWSPDGTRLAFESGLPPDIYVVNADGSGLRQLTNQGYSDRAPAWSPDGAKLAFNRHSGFDTEGEDSSFPSVYVMNADGSGLRRLTRGWAEDGSPAWSPDGTRIAFGRDSGAAEEVRRGRIYVINADGSGPRRLTDGADDTDPTWSNDATRLAFVRIEREGNFDIWVINADGSGLAGLTNAPEDDQRPAWSPDGSRIVFQRRHGNNLDIWTVRADGSEATRLTDHPAWDEAPAWSPDGRRLAFQSNRDGNYEIYVMNADGSGVARLTNHPARDLNPRWSPVSQPPSAPALGAGSPLSDSTALAAGTESFGPRFAALDSQLTPLRASLDSAQARLRRDSGTARADSTFRAFWSSYAARLTAFAWAEEDENWHWSSGAALDSAQRFFRAHGLLLNASEGTFWLTEEPDFLLRRLGSFLTTPMRDFLEVRAQEAGLYESDGGLLVSWDALADRIVRWETFLGANPGFARWDSLWNEARSRYDRYLSVYVQGLENTHLFDVRGTPPPDTLLGEVRASYERLLARHGGTQTARFVRGLLEVLRRTGYRNGPEVEQYLRSTPWPAPGQRRPGG